MKRSIYFACFAAVLLLIAFPGSVFSAGRPADTLQRGVELYTPYVKMTVPPGQGIDYTIDIINNSGEKRNVPLSVSGIPRGWNYELKAGGWSVNEIAVLNGEKKSLTLRVDVPLKVNRGTYRFRVTAGVLGELPLAVSVSKEGTYQTEFTTSQPNMEGSAASSFTFNTVLNNRTAEQQLYALRADAPRGWTVTFKPNHKQATSAQLEPNTQQTIVVEIKPAANVEAGSYKIPVTVSSGTTSAALDLEVVVTGSYSLSLTTPTGRLSSDITAGSTRNIELLLRNTGSAEIKDIQLSASKPSDWTVTFGESKVASLKPGASTTVQAAVQASKRALPGDYVVKVESKSPDAAVSADFRITVKTPAIWGWLGVLIIAAVIAGIVLLFRKYGRR